MKSEMETATLQCVSRSRYLENASHPPTQSKIAEALENPSGRGFDNPNQSYVDLVADCRRIIAKARSDFVREAQIQTLEAHHKLGTRIKNSVLGQGRPRREANGKTLRDLAEDLEVSEWTLGTCVRFSRRYVNVEAYLADVPSLRAARGKKNSDGVPSFSDIEPIPSWRETVGLLLARQRAALAKNCELPEVVPEISTIGADPLPRELIPYSVWPLAKTRPIGYGSHRFRGNTPPEVVVQCLERYTRPGDVVLDCMAGSGTTVDVCKALGRKLIASDIKAWRGDIAAADAETLALKSPVDFVFMHIPYLDMYEYTNEPGDLSRMNLTDLEMKLDRIIAHVTEGLKPGKFLAILVGDVRKRGLIDLTAVVSIVGQRHLKLWDKAIVETTNPGAHASAGHDNMGLLLDRARRGNFLLRTCDTLLVFRKLSERRGALTDDCSI